MANLKAFGGSAKDYADKILNEKHYANGRYRSPTSTDLVQVLPRSTSPDDDEIGPSPKLREKLKNDPESFKALRD